MKQFLTNMLSNSDSVSSKRVTGMLCVLVFIALVVVAFFSDRELTPAKTELLTVMFYGGLVMLGVGIVEKFKKL